MFNQIENYQLDTVHRRNLLREASQATLIRHASGEAQNNRVFKAVAVIAGRSLITVGKGLLTLSGEPHTSRSKRAIMQEIRPSTS